MYIIEIEKKRFETLSSEKGIGIVDILHLISLQFPKLFSMFLNRGLNDLSIQVDNESVNTLLSFVNFNQDSKLYIDEVVFECKIIEEQNAKKSFEKIKRNNEFELGAIGL